ncbi:hypothetical protein ACFPRL_33260 [Pseudoclavibacter helvolus]
MPAPPMPSRMRSASERAHTATTARTCLRSRPWRSTNAFCAPIATMRERPKPNPASGVSRSKVMPRRYCRAGS